MDHVTRERRRFRYAVAFVGPVLAALTQACGGAPCTLSDDCPQNVPGVVCWCVKTDPSPTAKGSCQCKSSTQGDAPSSSASAAEETDAGTDAGDAGS